MRTSLRLGLLPLLAALSGCSNFVEGNGVYAEKVLEAGPDLPVFSGATIGFPGDVDVGGHAPAGSIFAAAQARQVILSGDENVIEHIKVQVDATGQLTTAIDVDGYSSVHPPQLLVHAPGLAAAASRGGSDVAVHDAPDGAFSVTASGGGHVVIDGGGSEPLAALTVAVSSGAQVDASAYRVRAATLTLGGGARAVVWPAEPVHGTASGASAVLVKGGAGCAMTLEGGASCGPLP